MEMIQILSSTVAREPHRIAGPPTGSTAMAVIVGAVYLGKVRRLVAFGAFVEIIPETDGLLHARSRLPLAEGSFPPTLPYAIPLFVILPLLLRASYIRFLSGLVAAA